MQTNEYLKKSTQYEKIRSPPQCNYQQRLNPHMYECYVSYHNNCANS